MLKNLCVLFLIYLSLSGCSVYQSEGREFLEDQAFEFALQGGASISAKAISEPCAHIRPLSDQFLARHWSVVSVKESIEIYRTPPPVTQSSLISVLFYKPWSPQDAFVCELIYESEVELDSSLEHHLRLTTLKIEELQSSL